MGWLEHLGRAVRANINSLIQEAEDPEKILEEMILNLEQELIRMRQGLAEAIATLKRTERESQKHYSLAQTWHDRAQLALTQNNETLARQALFKWQNYQHQAETVQNQLEPHRQIINKLKKELLELEKKYTEAKAKKSLYLARLRAAMASKKMNEILGNFNNGSASTVFERIETKILELESHSELMSTDDPLERQFSALEGDKKIEAELIKMKAQQGGGQDKTEKY
ncbi:phage shock protein A, PspA [Gloeothece citriformis PCC 7424]|uniref:Phage shock protein A, PspA n=1 Tax=Gloeothece citriformis (strain PCC 7424) TaxID=65393 RepID=B7K9T6_GLOC7|nr:PspA/IM30 family protein [Gloeothece citriformis]ACK70054.1 phage shock protein A, PspA [Gloeothece citriformis PCC 7424]